MNDSTTLLNLQYLLRKVTIQLNIISTDVTILDEAQQMINQSQAANVINQIFQIISNSQSKIFWTIFANINSNSQNLNIKILNFSIARNRIRKEWLQMDQNLQTNLLQFIIQQIKNNLIEGGHKPILYIVDQILVAILRYEWNHRFKDFVSHFQYKAEQNFYSSKDQPTNDLMILKLLLEQGFETQQQLVSPSKFEDFRNSIQADMRSILQVLCYFLQAQGQDKNERILRCLQVIQLSIDYISPFQLFNCNIIQVLMKLIGKSEYQRSLQNCFEQIFRCKDINPRNYNNSKIAIKLLIVLEVYLQKYEYTQKDEYKDEPQQTASTQDSFHSRRTRKINSFRYINYNNLLNLLYLFLIRYVPFMDKTRINQDLDIQFQQNIKIYFSEDLYQDITKIFPRFIFLIENILEKLNQINYIENDSQSQQKYMKICCCIRLLIQLSVKIKIQGKIALNKSIQLALLVLTPFPRQYYPYYKKYGLSFQNKFEYYCSYDNIATQYQQEYKDLLKILMNNTIFSNIYIKIIQNLSKSQSQYFIISQSKFNLRYKQNQQEIISKLVSNINSLCWSAVHAYECNKKVALEIPILKIYKNFLSICSNKNTYDQIKICLSINSKILVQNYHPDLTSIYYVMISSLDKFAHTNEIDLHILSKIFLNSQLGLSIDYHEIQNIINRLNIVQQSQTQTKYISKMYPAVLNILIHKFQKNAGQKGDVLHILDILLANIIQSLGNFDQIQEIGYNLILYKAIYLLRVIQMMSNFLASNQNQLQKYISYRHISNWTLKKCGQLIKKFEFKNKMYSDFLNYQAQNNLQYRQIIKFKEKYIDLHTSTINLHKIKSNKQKITLNKQSNDATYLMITRAYPMLRQDFINQKRFKCRNFLSYSIKFYEWAKINNIPQYENLINDSIYQITRNLQKWDGCQQIQEAKYIFWKDLIKIFGFNLNEENQKFIVIFLRQLQYNIQMNYIQRIIDVQQQLIKVLTNHQSKSQFIFKNYLQLFKTTFQTLYSMRAQQKTFFQKIAHLFYSQIQLVTIVNIPFTKYQKRSNMEILFNVIQQLVVNHFMIRSLDQHAKILRIIFQQRNYARWIIGLKEYISSLIFSLHPN